MNLFPVVIKLWQIFSSMNHFMMFVILLIKRCNFHHSTSNSTTNSDHFPDLGLPYQVSRMRQELWRTKRNPHLCNWYAPWEKMASDTKYCTTYTSSNVLDQNVYLRWLICIFGVCINTVKFYYDVDSKNTDQRACPRKLIWAFAVPLRKHVKYLEKFTTKNRKFSDKNSDTFHISVIT